MPDLDFIPRVPMAPLSTGMAMSRSAFLTLLLLSATPGAARGEMPVFREGAAQREVLDVAVGLSAPDPTVMVEETPFVLPLARGPYRGRVIVLFHLETGCVVADVYPEPGKGRDSGPLRQRVEDDWRFAVGPEEVVAVHLDWEFEAIRVFPARACGVSMEDAFELKAEAVAAFRDWYQWKGSLRDRPSFAGSQGTSLRPLFPRSFLRSDLTPGAYAVTVDELVSQEGVWVLKLAGAGGRVGEVVWNDEWSLQSARTWQSTTRDILLSEFPEKPRTREQNAALRDLQEISAIGWAAILEWGKEEALLSGDERQLLARLSFYAGVGWSQIPTVAEVATAQTILERVERAGRQDLLVP